MVKLLILIFLTLIINIKVSLGYQELINEVYDGKKTQYIKVILDENHTIITSLSEGGETLENLVSKVGGISGVNGAYFCPEDYKQCNGINYSQNTRFYNGEKYSKYKDDLGANGLFGFDYNGKPLFILNNFGYVDGIKRKYNYEKINEIKYGIANFPVLLLEGENVVNESENIIDEKQKTTGIKSFICSENNEKIIKIGIVENITVKEMAFFLQKNLNCYNAINLDSGNSLGMIYKNKTIKKPGRKIMDAFVVIEKKNDLPKNFTDKLDKLTQNNPTITKKILNKISILKEKYKNNENKYKLLEKIEEYLK